MSSPQTPLKTQNAEEVLPSSPASLGTVDINPPTRATKMELAMMLALWAELKPDSAEQRTKLDDLTKEKRGKEWKSDNRMWPVSTGATLLDEQDMIISVAGSGYTHAAAYLCTLFPTQAKRGTMVLTQNPCSKCIKIMTQAGVSRIVAFKRKEPIFEDEPSVVDQEQLKETQFNLLLTTSTTAYSQFNFTKNREEVVNIHLDLLWREFKETDQNTMDNWHSGLAILASLRSEDPDLKVGAVLAKYFTDRNEIQCSIIYSVGYNGFRQQVLPSDHDPENKGAYSVHAEQNVLLFRGIHDLHECSVFTTHSPCHQCSCLIVQNNLQNVFFTHHYRAPCLIKAKQVLFGYEVVTKINQREPQPNALNHLSLEHSFKWLTTTHNEGVTSRIKEIRKALDELRHSDDTVSKAQREDLERELIFFRPDVQMGDDIMILYTELIKTRKPAVWTTLAGLLYEIGQKNPSIIPHLCELAESEGNQDAVDAFKNLMK